jgi:glucose/arabinose dehydrogenase
VRTHRSRLLLALAVLGLAGADTVLAQAPSAPVLRGAEAFGDWRSDTPGRTRLITPADLPPPYATRSASNGPSVIKPPAGAALQVPEGFRIALLAEGLDRPRLLRVAPNGDIFVAESRAGRIRVLRADAAGKLVANEVFASGLDQPFGIAFHPAGDAPRWVYVANSNSVIRFPYRPGELKPHDPPQTIVRELAPTRGGHWTRDVAFSRDGARMYVSVGSASNVAEGLPKRSARESEAGGGLGEPWGSEESRALVLSFTPDGQDRRLFATGIRNCVGMAISPANGDLWCSVNERDGLGDDLVPDYVTRVREGAFYGWPWFYIGAHQDPRHQGERPDLRDKVSVPDVLLQPHVASLQMTFYDGAMFPPAYRGSAFAALHGSWNRSRRVGYKIVRIPVRDGVPSGEHEDFVTGFVTANGDVWGRPVGVAVAADGALIFSEDGNGTIWRVSR